MRVVYNLGLVVAGIGAFLAYALLGSILMNDSPDFEITVLTILFQGIGYLVMMGVANGFYCLGPLSEMLFKPKRVSLYRRVCFGMGFGFSVMLPFLVPLMVILVSVTD